MRLSHVIFLSVAMWCGPVLAEGGCPPGQYPYDTPQARQCVPIPGSGSQGTSQPIVRYEDRWGAISVDGTVREGGIGTATGFTSKRKAEKAALAQCRATGGGDGCKVNLAYQNQCAVIGSGDTYLNTWGGPTIEAASKLALEDCRGKTTNCTIYYSGCSYPEQVE